MKMKIFSALLLVLIMNIGLTKAQTGKIVGTVYDENGETMPGVVVSIGEKNLAMTDLDGNFSCTIEQGKHILKFSFASYENNDYCIEVIKAEEINEIKLTMKPRPTLDSNSIESLTNDISNRKGGVKNIN
jgi:hypothetical protein